MAETNPFEASKALVALLQERYDKLAKDLPKLKENHKAATEELVKLNKRVVGAQKRLDEIIGQINKQTIEYNDWQTTELGKLREAQAGFIKERSEQEAKVVADNLDIDDRQLKLEEAETRLRTEQDKLNADQKELAEQLKTYNRWADNLKRQEAEQEGAREELKNMGSIAGERAQELEQREAKLVAAELEAEELVKATQRDRTTAKKILDDAKDAIALNDAREQALDIRDGQLKGRELRLNKKEAALNDRASVLASH